MARVDRDSTEWPKRSARTQFQCRRWTSTEGAGSLRSQAPVGAANSDSGPVRDAFSVSACGLVPRSVRRTMSILLSTTSHSVGLRGLRVAVAWSQAVSRSVMRVVASACLPACLPAGGQLDAWARKCQERWVHGYAFIYTCALLGTRSGEIPAHLVGDPLAGRLRRGPEFKVLAAVLLPDHVALLGDRLPRTPVRVVVGVAVCALLAVVLRAQAACVDLVRASSHGTVALAVLVCR